MIEPLKEVLDGYAAAQGWDALTREHVLLQFLANAANGPGGAAEDLRAFLTDLTADPDDAPVEEETDPRLRCYAHVEQLQEMLTANTYDPSAANWIKLDALLGALVDRIATDSLLEPAPAAEPWYVLTEAQLRSLTRLTDAARLLAAGLPAEYTTTPIGPLQALAGEAATVLLFLKPETAPEAGGG